ncbi:MAG: hypothetical protein U1D30_05410 [Planctomycetota bacterium]
MSSFGAASAAGAGVAAGADSVQLEAQLEQAVEQELQALQPWHFFLWQPWQALQPLQLWQPFFLKTFFKKHPFGLQQQETTAQLSQLETQLEQELQPWPPTVLIAIKRTVLNIGS